MAPLTNLQSFLITISTTIGIIAVMIAGVLITIKMTGKNKEGFRDALSSVAGIFLGIGITAVAPGVVRFATWVGQQIFG